MKVLIIGGTGLISTGQAHAAGRLPVTIFRPSHTFGPGAHRINNLGRRNDFISRLRQGRPVLVSGDGHGLWQSAFCDDVGAGFAAAIGRSSLPAAD